MATLPSCGPLLVLPKLQKGGDHPSERGYVVTMPSCGPILILPPPS